MVGAGAFAEGTWGCADGARDLADGSGGCWIPENAATFDECAGAFASAWTFDAGSGTFVAGAGIGADGADAFAAGAGIGADGAGAFGEGVGACADGAGAFGKGAGAGADGAGAFGNGACAGADEACGFGCVVGTDARADGADVLEGDGESGGANQKIAAVRATKPNASAAMPDAAMRRIGGRLRVLRRG